MSMRMRSGRSACAFANSGLAVADFGDRVAGPSEEIAEYAAQVFLIFDAGCTSS
jgi:hypothetical protein